MQKLLRAGLVRGSDGGRGAGAGGDARRIAVGAQHAAVDERVPALRGGSREDDRVLRRGARPQAAAVAAARRRQRDDPVRDRHRAGEAAGDAGREPVSGRRGEGGHRPARLHLLLSRRGRAHGEVRGQGLPGAVVHRARRRRPRRDGARSREAVGGTGGAAWRARRRPTAASRWASPRRTSTAAASSTARSWASRNCRRLPIPCWAPRSTRSATATPPSTCGRSGRRCRRTGAAPAFSTSSATSRRWTPKPRPRR